MKTFSQNKGILLQEKQQRTLLKGSFNYTIMDGTLVLKCFHGKVQNKVVPNLSTFTDMIHQVVSERKATTDKEEIWDLILKDFLSVKQKGAEDIDYTYYWTRVQLKVIISALLAGSSSSSKFDLMKLWSSYVELDSAIDTYFVSYTSPKVKVEPINMIKNDFRLADLSMQNNSRTLYEILNGNSKKNSTDLNKGWIRKEHFVESALCMNKNSSPLSDSESGLLRLQFCLLFGLVSADPALMKQFEYSWGRSKATINKVVYKWFEETITPEKRNKSTSSNLPKKLFGMTISPSSSPRKNRETTTNSSLVGKIVTVTPISQNKMGDTIQTQLSNDSFDLPQLSPQTRCAGITKLPKISLSPLPRKKKSNNGIATNTYQLPDETSLSTIKRNNGTTSTHVKASTQTKSPSRESSPTSSLRKKNHNDHFTISSAPVKLMVNNDTSSTPESLTGNDMKVNSPEMPKPPSSIPSARKVYRIARPTTPSKSHKMKTNNTGSLTPPSKKTGATKDVPTAPKKYPSSRKKKNYSEWAAFSSSTTPPSPPTSPEKETFHFIKNKRSNGTTPFCQKVFQANYVYDKQHPLSISNKVSHVDLLANNDTVELNNNKNRNEIIISKDSDEVEVVSSTSKYLLSLPVMDGEFSQDDPCCRQLFK